MRRNFETQKYGNVSVRNSIFDVDGTNLVEGLEIKILGMTENNIIEVHGYIPLDEITVEKIEELIEENS